VTTRLRDIAGTPPVTPAGYDSNWEYAASFTQFYRNLTLTADVGLNQVQQYHYASYSAETDVVYNVRISDPIATQTISGTVKFMLRGYESADTEDAYFAVKIYVMKPDGTSRGVLLAFTVDDVEVATSYCRRVVLASVSLSSVNAVSGDRIVIESGLRHLYSKKARVCATTTTTANNSAGADLPESDGADSDSVARSWVEFSQDINWYEPPSDVLIEVPSASVTMTTHAPIMPVNISVPAATVTMIGLTPTYQTAQQYTAVIPIAIMTLTPQGPTIITGKDKWRKEINILCHVLSATSGNSATSNEIIELDPFWYYEGKFYFEIVGYTSTSLAVDITLRRKGTSTDDATCSIPAGTTAPRVFRSTAFTPPEASTEYVVYIPNTTGATKYAVSARIVIVQEATTIERTENQIEIGNYETGKNNITTPAPLNYPKYMEVDFTKHPSAGRFLMEVVYKVESGATVTIDLQKDDGAFGSWQIACNLLTGGNATTPTRVRPPNPSMGGVLLAPRPGKHYRIAAYISDSGKTYDIYCAKIIWRQGDFGQRAILTNDYYYSTFGSRMSLDGAVIYCSCSYGTLSAGFVSTDYGNTWVQQMVNEYLYAVAALCGSDNGRYRYARFYSGSVPGFYRSDDYGETWTLTAGPTNITRMWCSRDGQYLIASNYYNYNYAIHRSVDYGATWDSPIVAAGGYFSSLYVGHECQHILYSRGTAFKRSDDYGDTWSDVTGPPDEPTPFFIYAMSQRNPALMYGRTGDYTAQYEQWFSDDYGDSWTQWELPGTWTSWRDIGFCGPNDELWASWLDSAASPWAYGMEKSTDGGQTWNDALDPHYGDIISEEGEYAIPQISDDENTYFFGLEGDADRFVMLRKKIFKTESEYLLENTYNNSAGLANHDAKWEPDDWVLACVSLSHVIDASADTGDSAKLQTDPNGTPADITGSTATGADRTESGSFTAPETAQTIDTYVLDAPIYASRLLAFYERRVPYAVEVADMTLTALVPIIYPLKMPVPSAALNLATKVPGYYIPPPVVITLPAAVMPLVTKLIHYSWDLAAKDAMTASKIYKCILTGEADELDDLILPISYLSASLTEASNSYVMVIVPAVIEYEDAILARPNGNIEIYVGYRRDDGSEVIDKIIDLPLDSVSRQRGGRRESITLRGHGTIAATTMKERTAVNVTSVIKQHNGKRVVTADIDFFLRYRDTFIYGEGGDDYVIAGAIGYEAGTTPVISKMTVTEL